MVWRFGVGMDLYVYSEEGWGEGGEDESQRDEEQLQCKKRFIETFHATVSAAMAMPER